MAKGNGLEQLARALCAKDIALLAICIDTRRNSHDKVGREVLQAR